MSYLLDTDTCIYWLRNRQSVRDKIREVGWNQITICVITVAELYYSAYNSNRLTENLARGETVLIFWQGELPLESRNAISNTCAVGDRIGVIKHNEDRDNLKDEHQYH